MIIVVFAIIFAHLAVFHIFHHIHVLALDTVFLAWAATTTTTKATTIIMLILLFH